MASGTFSKDNPLADIIPIEGAFVSSFLSDLSAIEVKTYVYLVYLCCHNEIKADNLMFVAKQLNITVVDLNNALEYLSKKNLINYTSRPFSFEILSATSAAKSSGAYSAVFTSYADYFAGIRALFPGRNISTSEYDTARDWIEIFGFTVEAALLLIAHCIDRTDLKVSFNYIDRTAKGWADDGIITVEKVEEYITYYQAKHHEVSKLLLHLGIKRTPTADEIDLYNKWTHEMGFDLKAIKAACHETTKSANPSLAYVNRILEGLHDLGLHSEKEIKAYLMETDTEKRLVSLILTELGDRSKTVTATHVTSLQRFTALGYKSESLILLAKLMCEHGMHTFTKFISRLEELSAKGIISAEAIKSSFEAPQQAPKSKNTKSSGFTGRDDNYGDDIYTTTSDDTEV